MDPMLYVVAGAAGIAALAVRARRREAFPTDLPVYDPLPTEEGVFDLGVYVPDVNGEPCLWKPWDGGEQHIGVFGTTNAGKTVVARLLAVTAKENWGWEVVALDGAKGGIDFTFMEDAKIGRVVSKQDEIVDALDVIADAIETRAATLRGVRVPRPDPDGVMRAVVPQNLRELTKAERERYGLLPTLVVVDELAILLANEKAAPAVKGAARRPIHDAILRITAAGRFVGIHFAAIMQRGDVDLLSGFIGSLLRARVLVGTTDQTAEQMAHGAASVAIWKELMGADGWEPDGMERALRPPGRAFVSGLARRAPGLAQMHRFDPITRAPLWDEWDGPSEPAPPAAPDDPASPDEPSSGVVRSSGAAKPTLRVVPRSVRGADYAEDAGGRMPPANPPSRPSRGRLRRVV